MDAVLTSQLDSIKLEEDLQLESNHTINQIYLDSVKKEIFRDNNDCLQDYIERTTVSIYSKKNHGFQFVCFLESWLQLIRSGKFSSKSLRMLHQNNALKKSHRWMQLRNRQQRQWRFNCKFVCYITNQLCFQSRCPLSTRTTQNGKSYDDDYFYYFQQKFNTLDKGPYKNRVNEFSMAKLSRQGWELPERLQTGDVRWTLSNGPRSNAL